MIQESEIDEDGVKRTPMEARSGLGPLGSCPFQTGNVPELILLRFLETVGLIINKNPSALQRKLGQSSLELPGLSFTSRADDNTLTYAYCSITYRMFLASSMKSSSFMAFSTICLTATGMLRKLPRFTT